ncbi:MAG TPA: lytic transglycosylase domain-containing protein [Actinomycetota bacterium]|nr:lytic transglycosylase domain-containing protein [Actinomycetota bacterium]
MRMRRGVAAVVVLVTVAACAASQAPPRERRDREVRERDGEVSAVAARGPTASTGSTGPAPDLPDPERRIPVRASRLADVLEETIIAREAAVERWSSSGGTAEWPVPDDVVLLTLYEQRIYRLLATRRALLSDVIDRLAHRSSAQARLVGGAGRALYEHFTPVSEVPDFRIRAPESADALRSYFRNGERRFEVAWEVLAAIMLVETRMGRIRSNSSAGAQGPMQFLPSTWDAYGLGGDVRDPHDAVLGAANYLDASGAPDDYRRALYAYNPVHAYVKAVWSYAKTMMRDPDTYYAFYNWQVFVRTTDGDVRLSGPGFPV